MKEMTLDNTFWLFILGWYSICKGWKFAKAFDISISLNQQVFVNGQTHWNDCLLYGHISVEENISSSKHDKLQVGSLCQLYVLLYIYGFDCAQVELRQEW